MIEYLLAVGALDIFFLDNIKADGADEWIYKFLIRLQGIIFDQLVISRELENEIFGLFLDAFDEFLRLQLLIFFKPCMNLKWTLVME